MSNSMQSVVQTVVGNIDWADALYNGKTVSSWEEAEKYINDNIISILSSVSEKTKGTFSDLLSIDKNSISTSDFIGQYHDLINQIIEELDMDNEDAREFRIRFNYVIEDDIKLLNKARKKTELTRTNTTALKAKEDWLNELSPSDLELFLTLSVDKDSSLEELKNALDDAKDSLVNDTVIDISPTIKGLESLQDIYKTLSSAVNEYNTTQGLSLDTVVALLQLDDRYLSTLISEDGQLRINAVSFNTLTQAKLHDLEVDTITNTLSLIGRLHTNR